MSSTSNIRVKIFNGIPIDINFFISSQCDTNNRISKNSFILLENEEPVFTIEAGTPLKIVKRTPKDPVLTFSCGSLTAGIDMGELLPFEVKSYPEVTSYDDIPKGYDLYVVMPSYREAVKTLGGDISKLAIPHKAVTDLDGKCKGFLSLLVG